MSISIRRLLAESFTIGGTVLVASFLFSTFSTIVAVVLAIVLVPVSYVVLSALLGAIVIIGFYVASLFSKKTAAEMFMEDISRNYSKSGESV